MSHFFYFKTKSREAFRLKKKFVTGKEWQDWATDDENLIRIKQFEKLFEIFNLCINLDYSEEPNYSKIRKLIEESAVQNIENFCPAIDT